MSPDTNEGIQRGDMVIKLLEMDLSGLKLMSNESLPNRKVTDRNRGGPHGYYL